MGRLTRAIVPVLILATGCATTPDLDYICQGNVCTVNQGDSALDPKPWEALNIPGYKPSKPGHFKADCGKRKSEVGKVNIDYITLDELAKISKDNPVTVHITEPSWCGPCFYECNMLKDSVTYLTVEQAKKIGWTGNTIPYEAKVEKGKIVD